ncbi:hypothetical protein [Capnocytophaga canimorsus]|nr:hypothetical protein [Capnocytophaga canimorsus]
MRLLLIILTLTPLLAFSQYEPKIDEYQHKRILTKSDTIHYHIYSKGEIEKKRNIIIFFHGSGGNPLFMQTVKQDTIKVNENGAINNKIQTLTYLYSSVPFDLDKIPDEYIFVTISKKGVPFFADKEFYKPNNIFYENESLDYRV